MKQKDMYTYRCMSKLCSLFCLKTNNVYNTNVSSTLIDVLLTNRPDYFIKSGTFDPEISDHCLIYGILNEKTIHHQPKTIMSRNLKSIYL